MNLSEPPKKFTLEIINYEFPNSREKDDANWLRAKISACCFQSLKKWEAEDSCLKTSELSELRNWFIDIINSQAEYKIINFIENELSFSYEDKILTAILDFAFHPKGENYDYDKDHEFRITFQIDDSILQRQVSLLDEYIKRFPIR